MINKRQFISSISALGLVSIANPSIAKTANPIFSALINDWLEFFLKNSPVNATQIGDHRFDNLIDDLTSAGRNQSLEMAKNLLSQLIKISPKKLSKEEQIDYSILKNALESQIFNIEELKEYSWNPLYYQNIAGGAVYNLMAREFAPIETRLRSAIARITDLSNVFSAMRAEIIPSKVPTPYALTYAAQHKGVLSVIDEMVRPHLAKLTPIEQAAANIAIATLRAQAESHQKWIDETLVPNAKADFRIGAELFDKMLRYTLHSDLTRSQIKEKAYSNIKRVRGRMYEIARKINANENAPLNPDLETEQRIIKSAIDLAASDRPKRDELVETSRLMTEIAREFVIKKDLITLPDGPVKIILMPEFQRGYAVAYCDSPGPLDKDLATFYAVSPIPEDWNDEKANSFLREYNNRGIQDIAVHEAMPGHYVQIFHANSYISVLRSVLSSGSFIEGWAVYAEQVMVEEGFKNDDPLYELTQLKIQLRTITNALIDQLIHCENMSEEEMMKLLTQTAFQEESEARGKWRRAQISITQLSTYFVGFLEHMDTRAAYKTAKKKKFKLKEYHNRVLSFGSPPMKFAKAMMLGLPIPI